MTTRLEQWRTTVGLPEIVNDIAWFLDRVAVRYGFSRRADLGGHLPRPPQVPVEDFLPEWCMLQERLYTAYRRAREVVDAVEEYIHHELQQPWPWLMGRLSHHVFQQAWEQALGIILVHSRTSPLDPLWEPSVQDFRFVFETKPGETVVEAQRRLMAEARHARKNVYATDGPQAWWNISKKGYPRKNQQKNVLQDTKWLYRHLIDGDIGRQIAQSWHHQRTQHTQGFSMSCGCERRVYHGLKNAAKLLSSTPYTFVDTDK